mmetsp:Transcript_88217/g.233376  ORF Transcript_88217/g.233376 Transcript_88217/m.233376 type:complete len:142 (+) Transcript_88217:257-682(+)
MWTHDTAALERELAKLNATVDAKIVEKKKKKKLDVGTHTSSYTLLGDGDCRCTGDGRVDRYVSSAWSDLGYDVADCQDVCSSYSGVKLCNSDMESEDAIFMRRPTLPASGPQASPTFRVIKLFEIWIVKSRRSIMSRASAI